MISRSMQSSSNSASLISNIFCCCWAVIFLQTFREYALFRSHSVNPYLYEYFPSSRKYSSYFVSVSKKAFLVLSGLNNTNCSNTPRKESLHNMLDSHLNWTEENKLTFHIGDLNFTWQSPLVHCNIINQTQSTASFQIHKFQKTYILVMNVPWGKYEKDVDIAKSVQ